MGARSRPDDGFVGEGGAHHPRLLIHVVEQRLEGAAQARLEVAIVGSACARALHQLRGGPGRERLEGFAAIGEVEIERADRHIGLACNVLGTRRLEAALGEQTTRGLEQTFTRLGLAALTSVDRRQIGRGGFREPGGGLSAHEIDDYLSLMTICQPGATYPWLPAWRA